MPLVSVLTATHAPNDHYLGELAASLVAQDLPAGWEWEWVVQEDGESPSAGARLDLGDVRVRHDALGVRLGASATRNVALARVRGEIVAGIDHDDRYVAGGLGALVGALTDDLDAAWTCGRSRLVLADGGTWTRDDALPAGPVAPGTIARRFIATDDFPFPAGFAAYRRDHLVAHGGWPATARSEDAVLLAGFSSRWPGTWVPRVVAEYRRWSQQTSVQPADIAIRDVPHVRGAIRQRYEAELRLGLLPPAPPPATADQGVGMS